MVTEAHESDPPRELYRWQTPDGNGAAPVGRHRHRGPLRRDPNLVLDLAHLSHDRGHHCHVDDEPNHEQYGGDDDPRECQRVAEFDGPLWFFSQDPSDKTDELKASEQVTVSLESGRGSLSIAGAASIVRDEAKIEELWSKRVKAWFPEGHEDPTITLIRVEAATAEYWAVNEPKAVVRLKTVKAAVTGGQPDVGDNHTIDL